MLEELLKVVSCDHVKTNVPMSKYTTFRTGGNADIMICPTTIEELKSVVKFFAEVKIPYYVLGNGSNLLVSDNGIKRPIIFIGKEIAEIEVFENCISARAGAKLSAVARIAAENSLTGFEFAAGIPGTIGGALIMNAGAYGGEMKDVVEAVSFLSPDGEEYIVSGEEMEFGYRTSALSGTDCIILGATLNLKNGNKHEIEEKMSELASKRREKQPLEFPSAGSTFKRPEGYFAGALIESCNLKGKTIGGAQVSEKHAGFIINKGDATTSDIVELIEFVKDTVYSEHGVMLEPEVKYWD